MIRKLDGMMILLKLFITVFLGVLCYAAENDYDSGEDNDDNIPTCTPSSCQLPNCSCFGTDPPNGLDVNETPQFVMLTFDDAISVANADTYFQILSGRKNKANQCPISMTFFVCHEYNDYNITNQLYRRGNEIAVHSITHETNTDIWKNSTLDKWRDEMVGMREILTNFGGIPAASITGHRAPFLQTAGDVTFQMLRNNKFLYDSSLPTRNFMDPPLWPYTLDHGYRQDCQIRPCPKSTFPGLWVVPMVQLKRTTYNFGKEINFHCSMADACTPEPATEEETKKFLLDNFDRHYQNNRAPFPLFLHEAWLRDPKRLKGYLNFLDEVLTNENVFLVTIQEVIDYMTDPVTIDKYKVNGCYRRFKPTAGDCKKPKNCYFPKRNRYMHSCVDCPRRYPWLENPKGLVIKDGPQRRMT